MAREVVVSSGSVGTSDTTTFGLRTNQSISGREATSDATQLGLGNISCVQLGFDWSPTARSSGLDRMKDMR